MNKKSLCFSCLILTLSILSGCASNSTCGNSNSESSFGDTIGPVYRVYFNTNGGTAINYKEVAVNSTVEKPDDPIYPGRTLLGWYTDSKLTIPFDFTTKITGNIVLHAKWGAMSQEAIDAYNNSWKEKSEANHLYVHYLRNTNTPEEYEKWDIWAWPKADGKAGAMFDFEKDENGKIIVDDLGGAYVDIDLTKVHSPAGWLNGGFVDGYEMSFMTNGELTKELGILIVEKESRYGDGHWTSDSYGDIPVDPSKALWDNGSYHMFCIQNVAQSWTKEYTADRPVDPYENDDGTNVSKSDINSSLTSSYGKSATSSDFRNNAGIGYQVMLASFADSDGDKMGDIYGVTKKLKYLKDNLNIDTLWLTPVQSSDSYHGYDIKDYKVVDKKFGSTTSPNAENGIKTEESAMLDYVDLLNEAEKLDIKVIMDLVINHTSLSNVWFLKSSQLDPEYRSFYHWKNVDSVKNNDNWHSYSTTNYAYYGKFASSMPELNYDYQGTRDAMVDVAEFWIDKGVDGFRIDAVKHIYMQDEVNASSGDVITTDNDPSYNANLTKNINFFQEFNARIKAKNPNVILVGENFDGAALNNVAPYYQGMDSLFDFYMYYNLSNVAMSDSGQEDPNGKRASSLANNSSDGWSFPGVLNRYNSYSKNNDAIESVFTSNHDVPRMMNMMAGTATSSSNQEYAVVNSSNASQALERAKCYATVMTMLPGITWIYYGDELGMSANFASGETIDSPHADRWYRQPYKFGNEASGVADSDGVYQTGFSFNGGAEFVIEYDDYNKNYLKSAEDQLKDSNSLLSLYKQLTALKSSTSALISGSYSGINTTETVYAFTRSNGTETYHIYVNFGSSNASVSFNSGERILTVGTVNSSSLGGHSAVIIKA